MVKKQTKIDNLVLSLNLILWKNYNKIWNRFMKDYVFSSNRGQMTKILFVDIEMAPSLGWVWSKWETKFKIKKKKKN